MPRYYCDYCDTYLTHDSPSVRKQHNAGYKHKANVRTYYQQFEEQQTQSLIDQRIKEHLGQAAAFQVGAAFHQHLATFPPQRPGIPILPTPVLPNPGFRPPVMQPPFPGAPALGYGATPPMPQVGMQPAATSAQPQLNSLPRMPLNLPTTSGAPVSASNNPPSMVNPAMYQMGAVPTSGGFNPNLTLSAPQGSTASGPAPAGSQTFETNQ